jgi:uncharacterized protein with PIN domain
MINSGKCPKCGKVISSVKFEEVAGSVGIGGTEWKCISCCCKSCNTVISVQIDPIAIKTDILHALGK